MRTSTVLVNNHILDSLQVFFRVRKWYSATCLKRVLSRFAVVAMSEIESTSLSYTNASLPKILIHHTSAKALIGSWILAWPDLWRLWLTEWLHLSDVRDRVSSPHGMSYTKHSVSWSDLLFKRQRGIRLVWRRRGINCLVSLGCRCGMSWSRWRMRKYVFS